MSFSEERALFSRELDGYYSCYPSDSTELLRDMRTASAQHPDWFSYQHKALTYEFMASACPVKIFRHIPFYFELDVGKPRTDLGSGGVGGRMREDPPGKKLMAQGSAWWQPCYESGLSQGWPVVDDNHLCLGQDNVFRYGLNGLIRKAQERLASATTAKECAFLESAIAGNRAVIAIANRMADEANRMLGGERDPAIRQRLNRIAVTARRVPAEPPATFYEAVNTLLFMREVVQSLEGDGISILGHLDRILWPYYERDIAEGRLTRTEAKDLLCFLLAFSDVRFGMREAVEHNGTNTTVVIGGCDSRGNLVYNEITRMVIEAYQELKLVDPKLNARLSVNHPEDYFTRLAELTAAGCNSLAVFNDDVIIAANVRMGKALEDCRVYVGGGCQENVLENTEQNSRATIYLNLAQVLLMGFAPERWAWFSERDGIQLGRYDCSGDFDALYATFLANLRAVTDAHIDQRNLTEREGWRYNPCPLHSSTMNDCLDQALDTMEGGARYNSGSVSLTGIGTLIDSLYAVREVVFRQSFASLGRLQSALDADYEGEESLRGELLRIAKYGQEDAGLYDFSAQVFADVARVTSGKANTRGGRYEASLFAFRLFTFLGQLTGATPDGRKAGEYLSPGMSPSTIALGRHSSIGQILNALEPLDLADFPVVAVLDMQLPATLGKRHPSAVLTPVMKRFLAAGGSVLQMNAVDTATLEEAKAHPERFTDLVVRISGYSAYFTTLSTRVQDEIIHRTAVEV
jgi:trans-4-hydroxy-L-proline dehydratase